MFWLKILTWAVVLYVLPYLPMVYLVDPTPTNRIEHPTSQAIGSVHALSTSVQERRVLPLGPVFVDVDRSLAQAIGQSMTGSVRSGVHRVVAEVVAEAVDAGAEAVKEEIARPDGHFQDLTSQIKWTAYSQVFGLAVTAGVGFGLMNGLLTEIAPQLMKARTMPDGVVDIVYPTGWWQLRPATESWLDKQQLFDLQAQLAAYLRAGEPVPVLVFRGASANVAWEETQRLGAALRQDAWRLAPGALGDAAATETVLVNSQALRRGAVVLVSGRAPPQLGDLAAIFPRTIWVLNTEPEGELAHWVIPVRYANPGRRRALLEQLMAGVADSFPQDSWGEAQWRELTAASDGLSPQDITATWVRAREVMPANANDPAAAAAWIESWAKALATQPREGENPQLP